MDVIPLREIVKIDKKLLKMQQCEGKTLLCCSTFFSLSVINGEDFVPFILTVDFYEFLVFAIFKVVQNNVNLNV